MFNHLDKDILKFYFENVKHSITPGVDRVTSTNFENNLNDNLDTIIRKVNNKTYKFSKLKEVNTSKGRTIYIPTIRDRLVIEFLKDRLKYKYKVNMPDRNLIIENVKSLLYDELDYFIIRLDIKNFFASISNDSLLSYIKQKTLLNSDEYYLLYKLLEVSPSGLPAGLSISNYLSEIFLEGFDIKLKDIHRNILFYSRYVDDILIIIPEKLSTKEIELIKSKINKIVDLYGLSIDFNNQNKNNFIEFYKDCDTGTLSYLGYSFYKQKNSTLLTTIDKNKLNNYYKKIDKMFNSYYYDNKDELLLYERLYAFCCNNKILKYNTNLRKDLSYYTTKQYIYYGVIDNYKYADIHSFKEIDNYIQKKLQYVYPFISDKMLKKSFHMLSTSRSKSNNTLLAYHKIPISTVRSKMLKISSQSNIHSFSNRKLLWEYIKLLNNY